MTTRLGPTGSTALAFAILLATAGCSDEETPPEATTPSATAVPTTAEPTTTTEPPATPEEVATKAALVAFENSVQVGQSFRQAPGARNWEPEIRQFEDEEAAAVSVSVVGNLLEYGIRQVGTATVEPEVTGVDLAAAAGPTVNITACYDGSATGAVFADTGEPTLPEDGPPRLERYRWLVTVIQYEQQPGSPWLVSVVEPQTTTPC